MASCFNYRGYGQEKIAEDEAVETFYGVVFNRKHPICPDHGEGQEIKLYSPLTLTTYAGYPFFPALLHGEKVPAYQAAIQRGIAQSMREYGTGGLAETLYNRFVAGKISSIVPDVEEHHGRLWGVARVSTTGRLTVRELAGLKEEWKEIAAHGWGELFASRILEEGHIRFHAGFWDTERGEDLCLLKEEELGKETGFLVREKISDSLLDGFRAESNRAGEGGVPDVLRPVWKSPGSHGQWRKGQLCVPGDREAGRHPL